MAYKFSPNPQVDEFKFLRIWELQIFVNRIEVLILLAINRNELTQFQQKVKNNKLARVISWPVKNLLMKLREFRCFHSHDKKRLQKFRGKHEGMRCFIIGNGPSLSVSDLEALRGEITFASNRIYRLFDKTDWRPTYWVASDPGLLTHDREQLLPVTKKRNTTFFITSFCKYFGTEPNIYYFLEHLKYRIDKFRDYGIGFSEDITSFMGFGGTVTYIAIQFAIFMGCKEIYLIGCDHNYSMVFTNGKLVCNNDVKNYPDDMKVGKDELGTAYLDVSTRAYAVAREYCEAHGILIANATRGGKLEVFERVALEDVLKKGMELY